jgi:hypothetical protein
VGWSNSTMNRTWWQMKFDLAPRPCSSLPQGQPQFLYNALYYAQSAENASAPELAHVAAVVCTVTPRLCKVEVVDDGVSPRVTALADADADVRYIEANFIEIARSTIPILQSGEWQVSKSEITGPRPHLRQPC